MYHANPTTTTPPKPSPHPNRHPHREPPPSPHAHLTRAATLTPRPSHPEPSPQSHAHLIPNHHPHPTPHPGRHLSPCPPHRPPPHPLALALTLDRRDIARHPEPLHPLLHPEAAPLSHSSRSPTPALLFAPLPFPHPSPALPRGLTPSPALPRGAAPHSSTRGLIASRSRPTPAVSLPALAPHPEVARAAVPLQPSSHLVPKMSLLTTSLHLGRDAGSFRWWPVAGGQHRRAPDITGRQASLGGQASA